MKTNIKSCTEKHRNKLWEMVLYYNSKFMLMHLHVIRELEVLAMLYFFLFLI